MSERELGGAGQGLAGPDSVKQISRTVLRGDYSTTTGVFADDAWQILTQPVNIAQRVGVPEQGEAVWPPTLQTRLLMPYASSGKNMEIQSKFPWLYQLFAGCFHQDWWIDAVDPDAVVAEYLDGLPLPYLREVDAGLTYLLEQKSDQQDLRRTITEDLGSSYLPSDEPGAIRAWLNGLRQDVRNRIAQHSAS